MKTKLLFIWAALGLLFTACEEEETSKTTVIYLDEPFEVNVYAGMPGEYGYSNGGSELNESTSDVLIKIYPTKLDYLSDQNVLIEGFTNAEGKFTFEHEPVDTLWFGAYKDTLSNIRGVTNINKNTGREHNEVIIPQRTDPSSGKYHSVYATLTNTPTRLQLTVSHLGQPVEGATVQLYFTEQTYQDSLAAQKDFEQLRPTYGYFIDEEGTAGEEEHFVSKIKDTFSQTTDEEGVVIFDNLEPRNYWFRITKDTLSNAEAIIRTQKALPRDANVTTVMTVGIN